MRRLLHALLASVLLIQSVASAHARSFIRDPETEDTLRRMSEPIFLAADISPESVRIFIINDPSINAFVAGGQNIFFHTGLITSAERPSMLLGVIAHEVGHIAGAHLSQLSRASENASLGALLSYILGAAAMIGGSPQAGGAILSAGQNTSLRSLLSHYRGNEQQADQAAVRYMRETGLSPQGMLDMFELLRRKERQHIGPGGTPYLRTHPLSTDRIAAMRNQIKQHSELPGEPDADMKRRFERMQAKLFAFLSDPAATFSAYPASDASEAATLARAVAWFKKPDLDKALAEVNQLIERTPDAFGYDLKGQILFEHGQIEASIASYERATQLAPGNGLILTSLGKSYLAEGSQPRLTQAIEVLERAAKADDTNATTQRQLAIAYGKTGKLGESYLALAREAGLQNNPDDVIRYAREAKEAIRNDPVLSLQADDLIADARRVREKEKDSLF